MISQFWRRITRYWRIIRERRKLTINHMIMMLASKQLIETYRTLQREVIIRSRNVDTNQQFKLLGSAIEFFVLADRDLQVLSYPYQEPWRDELSALSFPIQALIIYEVLRTRNAVIGKNLRSALDAHNLTNVISILNAENKALARIEAQYGKKFNAVRNTVIAHRDAIDPEGSMMRALPSAMIAGLITEQVQVCLRNLAVGLLEACLEIAKTLPPNSPLYGQ